MSKEYDTSMISECLRIAENAIGGSLDGNVSMLEELRDYWQGRLKAMCSKAAYMAEKLGVVNAAIEINRCNRWRVESNNPYLKTNDLFTNRRGLSS